MNAQRPAVATRDVGALAAEADVLRRSVARELGQGLPGLGVVDSELVAVARADPDSGTVGRPADIVGQERRPE